MWRPWFTRLAVALCTWMALPGIAQNVGAQRGGTPVTVPVDPARRVALVIGIGDYAGHALPNPGRDATAMAQQLARLQPGFVVIRPQGGNRPQLLTALTEFKTSLRGAAVGLFYFAGHGMEIDGQNFLIPLGVDMSSETDVRYNALPVDEVLKALDGVPARIVVLDACRNNPFQRGGSGGLAPTVGNALQGTLIAFATSPRHVALDGQAGRNGLYTASLLQAMQRPGVSIEEVFKLTRIAVAEASNGRQIPWESTSLTGSLVLQPAPAGSAAMMPTALPALGLASAVRGPLRPLDRFNDGCAGCPDMVVLPPGRFRMGSPANEPGRHPREGPLVDVQLPRPLAVGRREITVAEYRACVLDTRRPGDEADLLCRHWPRADGPGATDEAVVDVSWEDAQAYVRWLARRTGKPYRLLSEAEWEYAARGGSGSARPWGEALGDGQAVCVECSAAGRPAGPRRVAAAAPSAHPWGLQDMLGNVWEWVADCRVDTLDGISTVAEPRSSGDCAERGIRGGSWRTAAKGVRSASRAFLPVRQREQHVGFRVGMNLGAGQVVVP